ncbi:protein split ends isoform X4 [Rhizophagus clarus]|uniref:Protein split ends isoform X4 n=1 Tax=Rhizophagus clarus TaxID=94130 RepID=A0A8H3LVR6_9GLOM|nr:protein split ends isoform X4 [Rhizophagus clarus]
MTKRRGVTEKDKATKAAKTTKTIRTYVANSSHVDIGEDMLPEQEERNIEKERKENEKKEMERRDKERREKERREKERREKERREKERREKERREKERRERDRREKDKEQEENENDESESEEEIPVQFGAMTNQLQICNWLVLHPSVLHLANKMLDASTKQPSTNLPLTTSTSSPSDNVKSISYFEMKCLFLRTRNPPDHAFDKITQKIFGHDAYQSVAKSINERYRKSFSDYRYQLKNVLSTLVKEFRQIVESGYTESSDPTDEEVNNFISREVVLKRILSRYVSAIDFTKLSETSLDKLIEFSRKCFKIVWVETEAQISKKRLRNNVSIHKSQRLRNICEEKGIRLEFLPSYSPDYNPPIGAIQFVLLDKATPSDVHIKFKFEPGVRFEEIGGFEKIGEIEEIGEIDEIKVVKGVIDDEVTEESKGSEELKDEIESDKDPYVETGGEGEAIAETLRGEVETIGGEIVDEAEND